MKSIFTIIIFMSVLFLVFNWKQIVLEQHLSTEPEVTLEKLNWVDGFRKNQTLNIDTGLYNFKYNSDDTDEIDIIASFSWHFNENTNQVLVAGVLKSDSNNFEKEVEASATYSIEGSVIDFTEKTGHIAIFEKEGQVFGFNDNNELVFKFMDSEKISSKSSH